MKPRWGSRNHTLPLSQRLTALYPAIDPGDERQLRTFLIPQTHSYSADYPGEDLPHFRSPSRSSRSSAVSGLNFHPPVCPNAAMAGKGHFVGFPPPRPNGRCTFG